MEQMYLVEIFIDKVTVYLPEGEESAAAKKLILKIKFGPKTQFIIKEGQLASNDDDKKSESLVECDSSNRRKFTRTIRVGKSMLFPSYPDTVLKMLSKFPLEIEVWNDDENEEEIFVGTGIMLWDTAFYQMLRETADSNKRVEPLAIKQCTPLKAECCCQQVGEVQFILRLSALGENIITEFQQMMSDPEKFVFRTNRAPSMFECKRIEEGDPNFVMVGSLYETTTLEDPNITEKGNQHIEICTELQSCGMGASDPDKTCSANAENSDAAPKKKHPIDKIRMGDIVGPCGNANCPLAHKVRLYIRNLDTYKKAAENKKPDTKPDGKPGNKPDPKTDTKPEPQAKPANKTKNVCGSCVCKDERWHREECPGKSDNQDKDECKGCGGKAVKGHTCDQQQDKQDNVLQGKNPTAYVCKVDNVLHLKKSTNINKNDQIHYCCNKTLLDPYINLLNSCEQIQHDELLGDKIVDNSPFTYNVTIPERQYNYKTERTTGGCGCANSKIIRNEDAPYADVAINKSCNNPIIYNVDQRQPQQSGGCCCGKLKDTQVKNTVEVEGKPSEKYSRPNMSNMNPQVFNMTTDAAPTTTTFCTSISESKDCKCEPPKAKPPCNTFDCDCINKSIAAATRKHHKPYCPAYKHKLDCPVSKMNEEFDEEKKKDEDEDEPEPLPYGLPPIVLGPCPVMGRPCTVPDGFARMYKTAALAAQPPSYSVAGKVCCSKEYERIKKALAEYMKYEKESDFRCLNKFDVDTERRCCDKEQILLAMTGKSCCGTHKIAIQEQYKDEKK